MEIVGKIVQVLPEVSGVSRAGNNWKKREYVLETQENYPRKVHFDFFGEKADQYPLALGQLVRLSFDIESREFNGRWYTSIRGWKSEPVEGASTTQQPPVQVAQSTVNTGNFPPPPIPQNGPTDDLPF